MFSLINAHMAGADFLGHIITGYRDSCNFIAYAIFQPNIIKIN